MIETPTYASLFSSAGLGCYGLTMENFQCVATAELLPRRLEVQRANQICATDDAYYLGDLSSESLLDTIINDVKQRTSNLDVVIATPPCQGISVANHKKNNELGRNSLVIHSLEFIAETKPKFFILENVRGFLSASCQQKNGEIQTIEKAIVETLGGQYNILSQVVNLKDYGSPSSRTRAIVLGVRNNLRDITPYDIFPDKREAVTLRELIEHLPPLKEMGEISSSDIFHSFRSYDERMREWIQELKPGQSAFENIDPQKRPHRIIAGQRKENKASNGDKYRRTEWDKVPPCVHTRNDILASQSTVHPVDDRVFSIRELSLMMGVPQTFKWAPFDDAQLNNLPLEEKRKFLKDHDTNIRQCLGEGVPTPVVQSIARKIYRYLRNDVSQNAPNIFAKYIKKIEDSNPRKKELAAYYTRQDIVYSLLSHLPNITKKHIRVLEPSVGAGAFVDVTLKKFSGKKVTLDVIDIDPKILEVFHSEIITQNRSAEINVFSTDFLEWNTEQTYDLIIGNPPFGSSGSRSEQFRVKDFYAKFLERAMIIGDTIAFVVPKSFLSGPEFSTLRDHIAENWNIVAVEDYGERAFEGIKIETIGIVITRIRHTGTLIVNSRLFDTRRETSQEYITDPQFPSWLLYRNDFFDRMATQMELGKFRHFRDRSLTKAKLSTSGSIRVVKARYIKNDRIEDSGLYCHEDSIPKTFYERHASKGAIVVPNLTYYPRASRLPEGHYPDGSAAILTPIEDHAEVDSEFYSSPEFFYFYRIARNYSVRSLNIDAVSSYYWGVPFPNFVSPLEHDAPREINSKNLFFLPS